MKKNIIIIYGPTGSGKTNLSYKLLNELSTKKIFNYQLILNCLAKIYPNNNININKNIININFEDFKPVLINMDSKQVYYNFQSLTASPTIEEKSQYFHYLFNDLHPWESLTVQNWYQQVIDFINNTDFNPYIIIGGSSFYLKYFLTNKYIDSFHSYQWDFIINPLLKFPWDSMVKHFSTINRFEPNVNDDFRKFNFFKQYFLNNYSKISLNYQQNINNLSIINKNLPTEDYFINIIILKPSLNILNKNIINRAMELNIHQLQQEYYNIMDYSHHKNFSSIIGLNLLKNYFDNNLFLIHTLQYSKTQIKWIKYFLNNNFFNYSYYYCQIE